MKTLIISGLSGAGKSKAASFLEDMGYYIVDNMPAAMILKFAEFCAGGSSRYDRVALVYDVRTAASFTELFHVLDQLKQMEDECRMLFLEASPDTIIKLHLTPADTAEDVYRKMNAAVEEVKNTPLDSSFDNTAGALTLVPGVVLKFLVWLLKTLDYFGLLPAFLLEISPFHGSVFFTSMGSLGIPPIYHHLYNFGNLPVFGSFGCKRRTVEVQEDGSLVLRKYVDFKYTMDERIADGFYYASFFKHYKRILLHPEILDTPPTEINRDID